MGKLCSTVAGIGILTSKRTNHWIIAFETIDATGWYLIRIFSAVELLN